MRDERPPAVRRGDTGQWPVRPYQPVETLRPRSYAAALGTGTFGTTLTLATRGRDVAGWHAFAGSASFDFTRHILQGRLSYLYGRLPFNLRMDAFRYAAARNVEYNEELLPAVEHVTGLSSGVSYDAPGNFDWQTIAFSYSAQRFELDMPPLGLPDPYARLPERPHQGVMGVAHVGYYYTNAETTLYATGPEKGFTFGVGADYAAPLTASEHTLHSLLFRSTAYVLLPWARHHVLALGASGGTSGGTYPRLGHFFVGGFTESDAFDTFLSNTAQSAFVLRGYEPLQFRGRHFALFNTEYRFPLWYPDGGLSTLPVYLRTLSATLFADLGGAFDRFDPYAPLAPLHLGVGGELWLRMTVGYFGGTTLRLGWARGLGPLAPSGVARIVVPAVVVTTVVVTAWRVVVGTLLVVGRALHRLRTVVLRRRTAVALLAAVGVLRR